MNDVCKFLYSEASVVQSLVQGKVRETFKVSSLQSINSCCAEGVSQNSNLKEADKPSKEVGVAQKLK